MTTTDLLHNYQDGDFNVSIFSDGTKTRSGEGVVEFPESMDVKITDNCDAGCQFCHEQSTKNGLHGDLTIVSRLIRQLPAGVEVAIGGGHALAHPGFDYFVKELSEAGIICNVTINEKHFADCLPRIERLIENGYLYGIGYSYKKIPCTWKYEHLVTHVIVGVTSPKELPAIAEVNNKVLLLGYKNVGRGIHYGRKHRDTVDTNINEWYRMLFKAAYQAKLSFDNLAIEQLKPWRLLSASDYSRFYMGKDGAHSMYLDAVKQEFSVSSTSPIRNPFEESIREMFATVSP